MRTRASPSIHHSRSWSSPWRLVLQHPGRNTDGQAVAPSLEFNRRDLWLLGARPSRFLCAQAAPLAFAAPSPGPGGRGRDSPTLKHPRESPFGRNSMATHSNAKWFHPNAFCALISNARPHSWGFFAEFSAFKSHFLRVKTIQNAQKRENRAAPSVKTAAAKNFSAPGRRKALLGAFGAPKPGRLRHPQTSQSVDPFQTGKAPLNSPKNPPG